jgi:peptidoglycan/LPS O-acetylase OafA/YrhL
LGSNTRGPAKDGAGHGRIGDLDVLCGIAIAFVLAQHLPLAVAGPPISDQKPAFTYFGLWFGTDLLLAVAGFVGARALCARLETARGLSAKVRAVCGFWLDCVRRVAPQAWLWLVVTLACAIAFNRSGVFGTPHTVLQGVLASLLGLENLRIALAGPAADPGATYAYWALSLAAQFCLALPLVLFFCRSRLWPLLGAAIFFLLAQPRAPGEPAGYLRTDGLLLGALVAVWARQASYRLFEPTGLAGSRIGRILAPALLVLLLAAVASRELHLVAFTMGVVAVLAAVFVWLASYARGYVLPAGIPKRMLAWAGRRGLGLYLGHIPAFLAAREIWFRLDPTALTEQPPHQLRFVLTGLALVAVLAELSYRLMDAPLANLAGRMADVPPGDIDARGEARAEPGKRGARAGAEEWIS